MPEYTILSVLSVVVVVVLELAWFRTGIFRTATYWTAYGIVVFFQVLVDGWLTKLNAPIVIYSRDESSGIRVPYDIPIEDYAFGFSMVTLAIILWVWAGRARANGRGSTGDAATTRTGTGPTLPR